MQSTRASRHGYSTTKHKEGDEEMTPTNTTVTTTTKKKNKGGRPQIQIDQVQFEKLCELQCTLVEIAGWFKCSEDTIERWCKRTYKTGFAETYKKHSGTGKIALRRAQFRLAERNASMAIFLGKNYLGQSDRPEEIDTEDSDDFFREAGL